MTFLSVTSNSLSPRLSCHYLTSTLTFSFLFLISLLVSRPLPGWYNPWFLVSFSAHLTLFFRALHYARFHDVIMPVFISLAKVSLSSTWVSHCLCSTIICVFHSCLHSNTSKVHSAFSYTGVFALSFPVHESHTYKVLGSSKYIFPPCCHLLFSGLQESAAMSNNFVGQDIRQSILASTGMWLTW